MAEITPIPVEARDYRAVLCDELERRRGRNPRYSLRAFARDLGIAPNRLSEVLAAKQGLSPAYARRIAPRLGLDEKAGQYFCALVAEKHARSARDRSSARRRLQTLRREISYHRLREEVFRIISDWPHLAIIELSKLASFEPRASWIARKLGLAEPEVKEALHRLERVGLLQRENGTLRFRELNNVVPEGLPSSAVKRFHEGLLARAATSLWSQDVADRSISTTLLAFDKANLPQVKERIERFWQEIDRDFGAKGDPRHLYALGVQFFSLAEAAHAPVR